MFPGALLLIMTFVAVPARLPVFVQPAAQCLHTPGQETPAERQRNVGALSATRTINTAEAAYAASNNGRYATREQLAGLVDASRFNLQEGAEILPGFKLTLDVGDKGYWFEIVDTTDQCGYRFISNQQGLIFTAYPIR